MDHTLAIGRKEQFLMRIANLRRTVDSEKDYRRAQKLLRFYSEFWPPTFPKDSALASLGDEVHAEINAISITPERTEQDRKEDSLDHIFDFSRALRAAWDEPDLRKKEWLIDINIRLKYHVAMHPQLGQYPLEPPDETPFDDSMVRFKRIANYTKHCPNPDCREPYFIASKKSYKYCGAECAKPSQKKFKREWWAQHGPGWRKRRQNEKPTG